MLKISCVSPVSLYCDTVVSIEDKVSSVRKGHLKVFGRTLLCHTVRQRWSLTLHSTLGRRRGIDPNVDDHGITVYDKPQTKERVDLYVCLKKLKTKSKNVRENSVGDSINGTLLWVLGSSKRLVSIV